MKRSDRRPGIARLIALLAASVSLAVGGVRPGEPPGADGNVPRRLSAELGEELFFHETFGGNGRTCATCHDPRNEFTVSPELIRGRFAADPDGPLFRPVDSDDGKGRDYTTLLEFGLFNVNVPLHPDVSVVDDPLRRTITVRRGAPSIANAALTAPYLQDGRGASLQDQAAGAILDHMQPRRGATEKELNAIARFEEGMFYPLRLRALRGDPDVLPLDPDFSIPVQGETARRGKVVFDRHCLRCHDGELRDTPADPRASRFVSVFVSEVNVPNLPILRLAFKMPDGSVVETITPDPGRGAITGRLEDLNAFDTPPLRGLKHTAPYFHDNSAPTLGNVVDHYNNTFQFRIFGRDREDLIAYLELL